MTPSLMASAVVLALIGTVLIVFSRSLLVLDVVTAPELRDAQGKTLLVIGIFTTAILLLIGAVKLGIGPRKPSVEQAASPPRS